MILGGWGTRVRMPSTPNIQGHREETPNGSLVDQVNLRDGEIGGGSHTPEPPRA
jgi:hypothetical protein